MDNFISWIRPKLQEFAMMRLLSVGELPYSKIFRKIVKADNVNELMELFQQLPEHEISNWKNFIGWQEKPEIKPILREFGTKKTKKLSRKINNFCIKTMQENYQRQQRLETIKRLKNK